MDKKHLLDDTINLKICLIHRIKWQLTIFMAQLHVGEQRQKNLKNCGMPLKQKFPIAMAVVRLRKKWKAYQTLPHCVYGRTSG